MSIKIYTTGGTIDKIHTGKQSTYEVGAPQIVEILQNSNVILDYEIESIIKKDSLDFTNEDRELIYMKVKSDISNNILITHGTDTMIKTAKILKNITKKTIVFTGSMYPAKYQRYEAVLNIGCAITASQILDPGVYIAMNGRIFDPHNSRKNVNLNRFEEINK